MNNVHNIRIIQEDPKATKINDGIRYFFIKWSLTIISVILVGILINTHVGKPEILAFGIFLFLGIFAWYKDIKLFLKRKKKFGANWKFIKDPLIKEFIVVIVIVLIIYWLIFF